jgi:hypothetical protein
MIDRVRKLSCNPRFWQWFHMVMIAKWVILFGPGMLLWRESVPFLMYVSLDTALTGSIVGLGTALAGRKADTDDPL